jgi:Tfp pilus assembly protein PilO
MSLTLRKPNLSLPTRPDNSVPRSQAERLWLIGGGLVGFLAIVIAYFFFISPQRSETDDVRGRIDNARSQNAGLQAKLDQLRQENKNLDQYRRELAAAQAALPSTADVSDFLRALQSLGSQTQTNVTQLSVGQPTNVSAAASGQLAPGATPAPGTTPTPNASASPNAAAAAAGGAAPAPGAAAGPGVYSLPVKAEVTGSPADLTRFLDQLQNVQPRAVLITSLVENSGGQPGAAAQPTTTVLDLSLQVFVVTAPTVATSTGPAK